MPNFKKMWLASSCATIATIGGNTIANGSLPIAGRMAWAQNAAAIRALPAAPGQPLAEALPAQPRRRVTTTQAAGGAAAAVPSVVPVAATPALVPAESTAAVGGTVGAAGVSDASADSWLTYKGDLQRTGARPIDLQLPLNLLWRHSTEAAPNSVTAPLVTGPMGARRVYFAAGPAIFCVDGQTGEQIWRSEVLTKPVTAPISLLSGENGDMILAITSSGQMSALRTTDGGQLWEADARSPVQTAAPILVNTARGERIIVGVALGRLLAFTREGALDPKWDIKIGRQGASLTSTPALTADGKFLFLTAQDGKLYCIDVMGGDIHYSVQLSTTSQASPLVLNDQVVVAAGSIVSGYKISTGDPIWRTDTKGGPITASPAAGRDAQNNPVVYIGAKNGSFFGLETKRGAVQWKADLGESVTGTAVVLNNTIMVGTGRGMLYGLKPSDGTIQWQYRLRTERAVPPRLNANRNNPGGEGDVGIPAGGEFGGGYPGGGSSSGSSSGSSGGFPGGEFGGGYPGGGGAAAPTSPTPMRTYGVSSPPAVVNGQVFLLADNAALYAFDIAPFDATPPRAVEPSLSVPAREGGFKIDLIAADKPLLVPGKGKVYFAVVLDDTGSGIDPNSIRVTANNEEIPKERAQFQPSSGTLTVTLNKARAGSATVNLPDGVLAITVTAKDYNGNALNYSGSITIDNSIPPPSKEPPRTAPFGGGYPGGSSGGYPGSGGFSPGP